MFCTLVSMFHSVLSWFLFGTPEGRGFRARGAGRKKLKDTFDHINPAWTWNWPHKVVRTVSVESLRLRPKAKLLR